jgi:transglutaminase-like putative cysteine protease
MSGMVGMSGGAGGWRLQVRHHTGFRYAKDVHTSYNEARLTPPDTETQLVIEHQVEVHPAAVLSRYRDYWGTWVHAFDLHRPHKELAVTGHSVVVTGMRSVEPAPDLSWEELHSPAVSDAWCEFLDSTAYSPLDQEMRAVAEPFADAPTPRAAVEGIVAWLGGTMEYQKGSTTVATTAPEALRAGRGVCQDFAHVGLAMIRSLGIPGRYTSGYLHPSDDAPIGVAVSGDSHAWIEAWLGSWAPYDPTSGVPVETRHVVIAHGRDYADVPPLKGVYHGGPSEALDVHVELTRLA